LLMTNLLVRKEDEKELYKYIAKELSLRNFAELVVN